MEHLPQLQILWAAYVSEKPFLERWVHPDLEPHPLPQKRPARKTDYNTPRNVGKRSDGRFELVSEEKNAKEIILVDEMCEHIVRHWTSNKMKQEEFVKKQLAEFAGVRRADILFILQHLRSIERGGQLLGKKQPVTISGAESLARSRKTLIDTTNAEQRTLLKHKAVQDIFKWFHVSQSDETPTYFTQLARIAIHIIDNGQAAQTSESIDDADFLVLNCTELEEWLLTGNGKKTVLLRDRDWLRTRPYLASELVLRDLKSKSGHKKLFVDVQDLNKVHGGRRDVAAEGMSIDEVMKRWDVKDKSKYPINMLNLSIKQDGLVPWPLAKHCTILNEALESSAAVTQSIFNSYAGHEEKATITKAVDIDSSIHFQILGQAGSVSTWHIDHIGPYTYVTLEPNHEGPETEEDFVLKLWAIMRTDNLTSHEYEELMREFQRDHQNFAPPRHLIRIISLTKGDTLIMPPGTIHAPITVTDCLFRGGMVMQSKHLKRSIKSWRFTSANRDTTNQEVPKQARSVMDFFRARVQDNPEFYGYIGDGGKAEFEDDWIAITRAVLPCGCTTSCTRKSCGCRKSSERCGGNCPCGAGCQNPFGSEKSVQSYMK